jgi:hypothetical protein
MPAPPISSSYDQAILPLLPEEFVHPTVSWKEVLCGFYTENIDHHL